MRWIGGRLWRAGVVVYGSCEWCWVVVVVVALDFVCWAGLRFEFLEVLKKFISALLGYDRGPLASLALFCPFLLFPLPSLQRVDPLSRGLFP